MLWATRVATILFTAGYILPVFGNPYSSYYKALMASAATSALRLHQRLPQVQFNTEFLGKNLFIMYHCLHWYIYFSKDYSYPRTQLTT